MVRIPTVGGDQNVWGTPLAELLEVVLADNPPTFKAQLFGTGLNDKSNVPYAADYTAAAIAGTYDTVPSLADLTEQVIGSQLTGLSPGQIVRLTPGIYREIPTIDDANVKIYGLCDVSFRASDNWSTGGVPGNTWATAAAPNATNGIVSSLTVPAMAADSGGGPVLGGNAPSGTAYSYLAANREQVFVDGIQYNRRVAGATLVAGEWCFVHDTTDRRVVIFLAGGAGTHLIEVTTRESWLNIQATGVKVDGIDFRHCPSGLNAQWAMGHNNFADVTWKNCMIGYTHGQALTVGSATGVQVLECVFHNCESAVIGYNSPGVFFRDNVIYNCGGTQRTYAGFLSPAGYDETWGSGALKMSGTDGGV